MEYQKLIHEYLQSHKQEIVETLKNLVKIPSKKGLAEENAPFGKECAKVLQQIQTLYQKNGYETELDEKGGYLLSYFGDGEKSLGLFAHADVVAGGEGWIYTTPFEPIEKDGFLIGRGVLDDKSAVVASLYVLKMLKELQIPVQSKIVCYTGTNEETGMQDMVYYTAKHTPPNFSLVMDSAFPLYHGNKGVLRCMATSKIPLNDITEIFGGKSVNITLGKAYAKLPYCDSVYNELKGKETERLEVSANNGEIILQAEGISKHGALPEGSINAGFLIASALQNGSFLSENDRKQLSFLAKILPDIYGKTLGIANEDCLFGKLTCSNGLIKIENGKISFSLDIRFGKNVSLEELKDCLTQKLKENGFNVEFMRSSPAHLTDINNPYIQACLQTYKTFTGELDAKPRINAGGTYAKYLPSSAEIGITTWRHSSPFELPQGHGLVHQPDESISIEDFLEAIEIATLMVIACDKERN